MTSGSGPFCPEYSEKGILVAGWWYFSQGAVYRYSSFSVIVGMEGAGNTSPTHIYESTSRFYDKITFDEQLNFDIF